GARRRSAGHHQRGDRRAVDLLDRGGRRGARGVGDPAALIPGTRPWRGWHRAACVTVLQIGPAVPPGTAGPIRLWSRPGRGARGPVYSVTWISPWAPRSASAMWWVTNGYVPGSSNSSSTNPP